MLRGDAIRHAIDHDRLDPGSPRTVVRAVGPHNLQMFHVRPVDLLRDRITIIERFASVCRPIRFLARGTLPSAAWLPALNRSAEKAAAMAGLAKTAFLPGYCCGGGTIDQFSFGSLASQKSSIAIASLGKRSNVY